jgi:hypothetical protein
MRLEVGLVLLVGACASGSAANGSGGPRGGMGGGEEDSGVVAPDRRDAAPVTRGPADAATIPLDVAMPDVAATAADAPPPSGAPLLAILDQFSAPDVPARGPKEAPPIPHYWILPASLPTWPGNGLAQHPMLYAGEGFNVLIVVNHGKVVWTYSLGPDGEIDDVWMLSNGHVLVAFDHSVLEITPKKDVVWQYVPPLTAQVHSCQPIGLDKVLFVQNDTPPHVKIINKTTGMMELDQPLPAPGNVDPGAVHTQFRRFRMTAAGTYLASWLQLGHVVEYDKDLKPIWDYPIATPWSSIRLRNGNTLITSESARTIREVSPKSATVWEWKQSDLPPNTNQQNTQSADRLANGDTVIFASRSPKDPAHPNIQAIEVAPDKKVVWVLQDWKDLGPAATAQFLDEPGIPENPGELQH